MSTQVRRNRNKFGRSGPLEIGNVLTTSVMGGKATFGQTITFGQSMDCAVKDTSWKRDFRATFGLLSGYFQDAWENNLRTISGQRSGSVWDVRNHHLRATPGYHSGHFRDAWNINVQVAFGQCSGSIQVAWKSNFGASLEWLEFPRRSRRLRGQPSHKPSPASAGLQLPCLRAGNHGEAPSAHGAEHHRSGQHIAPRIAQPSLGFRCGAAPGEAKTDKYRQSDLLKSCDGYHTMAIPMCILIITISIIITIVIVTIAIIIIMIIIVAMIIIMIMVIMAIVTMINDIIIIIIVKLTHLTKFMFVMCCLTGGGVKSRRRPPKVELASFGAQLDHPVALPKLCLWI